MAILLILSKMNKIQLKSLVLAMDALSYAMSNGLSRTVVHVQITRECWKDDTALQVDI